LVGLSEKEREIAPCRGLVAVKRDGGGGRGENERVSLPSSKKIGAKVYVRGKEKEGIKAE